MTLTNSWLPLLKVGLLRVCCGREDHLLLSIYVMKFLPLRLLRSAHQWRRLKANSLRVWTFRLIRLRRLLLFTKIKEFVPINCAATLIMYFVLKGRTASQYRAIKKFHLKIKNLINVIKLFSRFSCQQN